MKLISIYKIIRYFLFFISIFVQNISVGKTALITGITGQDGYYLSQFLLEKEYAVHGVKRITSTNKNSYENEEIVYHLCDLDEIGHLVRLLKRIRPDEIYHLAVQSQIHVTYLVPEYSARSNALGVLNMLEAIRLAGLTGKTKFFQAASCELFGRSLEIPQTETTPFHPCSPYGSAKLFGYYITKVYREKFNVFACSGILFNHESPRRGETFVTRKITRAVAAIKYGHQEKLTLGNLDAKKDWGFAKDYVEAMWLMLQQNEPDDYIIASGKTHSVREFVEEAFKAIDITITWQGSDLDEKGIEAGTNRVLVEIDPRYFRPIDVSLSLGDITKAKTKLGWAPRTKFKDLVRLMVLHDLSLFETQKNLM